MPETKNIVFDHKEVVEALLKTTDIHEGIWGLYLEFGLAGANIGPGPKEDLMPAAIVSIRKIGLQKFDEASNLTVDASKINPKKTARKKKQ